MKIKIKDTRGYTNVKIKMKDFELYRILNNPGLCDAASELLKAIKKKVEEEKEEDDN